MWTRSTAESFTYTSSSMQPSRTGLPDRYHPKPEGPEWLVAVAHCVHCPLIQNAATPAGDVRHRLTCFQEEEVSHNIAFVNAIKGIAEKKAATPAQLAIS